MKILVLSTSLLTNRLLSQSFFKELEKHTEVTIWANSKLPFAPDTCVIKSFPVVKNNREWVNFLRRINESAWTERLSLTSILSMKKFQKRQVPLTLRKRFENFAGKSLAFFRLERASESMVKRIVKTQDRGKEIRLALGALKPDVVLTTNPFWLHETSVAIEAKKLGIKVFSIIPSWDNITTKSRITYDADMYFVWSKIRTEELKKIYPKSREKPVFEYGTPQYECFYQPDFHWSREAFCSKFKLDPKKKIILYTTGSPNFLKTEYEGAATFSEIFRSERAFENCQLLIRPHPNKDSNEMQYLHRPDERVFVQVTPSPKQDVTQRPINLDQIEMWVNTFLHCDIVINLSSTVLLDAMAFDKPVININFDPGKQLIYEEFIKEINGTWHHLATIKQSEAIPQSNSFEEIKYHCLEFLKKPQLGLNERREVFHKICKDPRQPLGKELAKSIISELHRETQR